MSPDEIVSAAEKLIRQAEQSLVKTRDALAGVAAGSPELTPATRAEAEALFREDLESVEREVAEEAARLAFAGAPARAGGARKLRNMI